MNENNAGRVELYWHFYARLTHEAKNQQAQKIRSENVPKGQFWFRRLNLPCSQRVSPIKSDQTVV